MSEFSNEHLHFELEWNGIIFKDRDGLNASVIWDAIYGFCCEYDDYIILLPQLPKKNNTYLQAHSPDDDTGLIDIEFRQTDDDGSFQHYQYQTADKKEIYQYFIDYWAKGNTPDLSSWTDITNEMNGFSE